MFFSVLRKAPLAVALMLGCAALPAQAGWFSSNDKPAQKTEAKPAAPQPAAIAMPAPDLPATNLDESIRQAQMLRLAGQYSDAVKHLSQLMMVASDDPRVVSEYGKTLAAMGRASDAVNFLTRAQQLQPTDWTLYSAMGVAYDQLGDQKNAQNAYEHALALKADEASVLSNYALSRLLAKDPDMARKLAARAESAGGAGDAKIARNIAMIRSLAPEAPEPAPVAANVKPPVHEPVQAAKTAPQAPEDNRVVMQRVPVDPQAGPVAKPVTVNQAPRSLQPQLAADHPEPNTVTAQPLPKPVTSQPLPPPVMPVKAAEAKPVAEAAKPIVKATPPAPTAQTASASVTLRLAPPLKSEGDKPGQAPKVLPPAAAKTAAKPANPSDIPGLRVSENAY